MREDLFEQGHHKFKTIYCEFDGYERKVLIGCGRRSCGVCRKRWYGQHFEALLALVKGWLHPRFITLTLKNISDAEFARTGRESVKYLRRCFAELRKRIPWIEGGFYAVETTNHGRGWHLHMHVVYDGGYVDKKRLKAEWAEITGGSYIADVKEVFDAKGAVNYLLKDLLKSPKIRLEDIDVFDAVFKRVRMIQPFGPHEKTKYRVIRVPFKCPLCGGTDWVAGEYLFSERRCSVPWLDSDGLSPP